MQTKSDTDYMQLAIEEAKKGLAEGELPIGAIIVCQNTIIARAHNYTERLHDVTAHAEMQAFTSASSYLGGKYLPECCLYVTLEPCVMCAGASYWTHIGRIVYGAEDPKKGFQLFHPRILHPKTEVLGGVLKEECADLLTLFFKQKR